jgi:hypothetical protein
MYKTAVQLLCFWTLTIFLLLFKTQCFGTWALSVFRWNLLSWVQSIELVPIHLKAETKIHSPKLCVLNKIRTMDKVQKHNNRINIPPLLTFKSYKIGVLTYSSRTVHYVVGHKRPPLKVYRACLYALVRQAEKSMLKVRNKHLLPNLYSINLLCHTSSVHMFTFGMFFTIQNSIQIMHNTLLIRITDWCSFTNSTTCLTCVYHNIIITCMNEICVFSGT